MVERIDDPKLSVTDLAEAISTSERNLFRMIQKLTGLTSLAYIKEIRWQYVEKGLKEKLYETLSAAAQSIGQNNFTNFSKQFGR